jgi:hypothetical protein
MAGGNPIELVRRERVLEVPRERRQGVDAPDTGLKPRRSLDRQGA